MHNGGGVHLNPTIFKYFPVGILVRNLHYACIHEFSFCENSHVTIIWKTLFPKNFYTTKISNSVCMYGCMYVCLSGYAFRHALRYRAKSWRGVGDGPTRFVGIFLKRPHLRSKVIQRSICLKNALWLPNLVKRSPDHSVVHCWGQRSCRGHLRSTRGQIA